MFNLDVDFNRIVLKILLTLLFLVSMFACSDVFAAENYTKWEAKVTTDSTGGSKRIEITGSRKEIINGKSRDVTSKLLDYKPAKGVIGRTMFKRLMAGAGGLGVAGVVATLHRYGYFLDEATGLYNHVTQDKYYWMCDGEKYYSPNDWSNCQIEVLKRNSTFNIDIVSTSTDPTGKNINLTYSRTTNDGVSLGNQVMIGQGIANPNPNPTTTTLTSDKLDEILTSPTFNPDSTSLADALTPDIANGENPENFEPYKDINTRLKANEVYSSDNTATSTSTTTDSQGNESTTNTDFKFPDFCDYATKLCSWLDWTQKEHEQDTELDFEDEQPISIDTTIRFNGQCPAPLTYDFTYGGQSQSFGIKDFTPFCSMLNDIFKPIVIAVSSFVAVLIIGGVRTDE
ncbi:virulence factor TspB C-terminal domain-related protein [Acinetobacter puyangensis]|uniref:virulence factor TspB C-terminal domain-related protein n=1 Tax=Acinetobacter puyangensis TaxID=1096779 RepID=UPI003A4DD6CB